MCDSIIYASSATNNAFLRSLFVPCRNIYKTKTLEKDYPYSILVLSVHFFVANKSDRSQGICVALRKALLISRVYSEYGFTYHY